MESIDYKKVWPKDSNEVAQYLDDIVAQFPGWETYTKENGEELYNLSVDLAVDMCLVVLNFAGSKLGLSMMQASMVPGNLHKKAFGEFL